MVEFTCSNCGERVRGDECPRCRAATAIATPEDAEQAKVTPPASSDGAIRGGLPRFQDDTIPSIRKEIPNSSMRYVRFFRSVPYFVLGCFPILLVAVVVATAIGLLIPKAQRVGIPSPRVQTINNVKQIALACHAYHDTHKRFPTPKMVVEKDGKDHEMQLSWRVVILPYFEQLAMFKAFDRTVGWDHPKNLPFQDQMPDGYTCPYRRETDPTRRTHFQYFTGQNTLFPDNAPLKLQDIRDSVERTILIAEADQPVIWTRPAEMVIRLREPLPLPQVRFLAAMVDSSVHMISRDKTSDTIVRQLIHPNDQKPDPGWDN